MIRSPVPSIVLPSPIGCSPPVGGGEVDHWRCSGCWPVYRVEL